MKNSIKSFSQLKQIVEKKDNEEKRIEYLSAIIDGYDRRLSKLYSRQDWRDKEHHSDSFLAHLEPKVNVVEITRKLDEPKKKIYSTVFVSRKFKPESFRANPKCNQVKIVDCTISDKTYDFGKDVRIKPVKNLLKKR